MNADSRWLLSASLCFGAVTGWLMLVGQGCATAGGGGGGGGGDQVSEENENQADEEFTISDETFGIDLADELVEFEVEAGGAPVRQRADTTLFTRTPIDKPSSGDLRLDDADVEVRARDGGDSEGVTGTVLLRIALAARGSEDPFEEGTEVGTFRVRLEQGRATVENSTLSLPLEALDRARTGSVTLGFEAASDDMDAGLTVHRVRIAFGTAEEPAVENDNASGEGDGDGANANENGDDSVVEDPAPDRNTPGEFGCDRCPDSDIDMFDIEIDGTSQTFDGTVTDAEGNGVFFVQGPDGEAISGTIPTETETGDFSFTAPLFCGEQLVKCVWSNAAGSYVLVVRVITTNCVKADIRITLTWDDLGRDWELHLIKPGGRINDDATDCTWTSCISASPDWGVQGDESDNPSKDVDDTGDFGPEGIFLANPEAGTYTVMVEHWGSGDPGSDGQVVFNVSGVTVTAQMQDLASHWVWTAGTIDWPSGTVQTNTEVFDCADQWSDGCQADVP